MTNINFDSQLQDRLESANETLGQLMDKQTDIYPHLKEAICYTLEAGGKRIRAAIVMWCCEVVSGKINRNAEIAAAAIEMVHTYSLVHDDLPAMDNDDFRRGKPTCHKAFDDATAILAGDGLLTLAFEVIANEIDDPVIAIGLVSELAKAAGPAGMIAGQVADLKSEKMQGNEKILEYIHLNKTAKMFSCAAAMGAIAGGAEQRQMDCLR